MTCTSALALTWIVVAVGLHVRRQGLWRHHPYLWHTLNQDMLSFGLRHCLLFIYLWPLTCVLWLGCWLYSRVTHRSKDHGTSVE